MVLESAWEWGTEGAGLGAYREGPLSERIRRAWARHAQAAGMLRVPLKLTYHRSRGDQDRDPQNLAGRDYLRPRNACSAAARASGSGPWAAAVKC
jgi:hypothetical protein